MSALPEPNLPPIARLRSFHPFLLLLSAIGIVAVGGAALYVAALVHAHKGGAVFLVVPIALYGVARIFLPVRLTADANEIRWEEPFHAAQVVPRRDIAGIEQRVVRNSSYAYLVDREGRARLSVGPIFSPTQMRSFASAVGLPIRDVVKAPPSSNQLLGAEQRGKAEKNRSMGLAVTGTIAALAVGLMILMVYLLSGDVANVSAYRQAPVCTGLPVPDRDCRYQTTAVVSSLQNDRSGRPSMTLTFSADVFTVGSPRQAEVSLVGEPSPALENGATATVEVWRRQTVTQVNGVHTSTLTTLESNADGFWFYVLIFAVPMSGAIGFFVWQWRSKPA